MNSVTISSQSMIYLSENLGDAVRLFNVVKVSKPDIFEKIAQKLLQALVTQSNVIDTETWTRTYLHSLKNQQVIAGWRIMDVNASKIRVIVTKSLFSSHGVEIIVRK